jgi:hypothetical protein
MSKHSTNDVQEDGEDSVLNVSGAPGRDLRRTTRGSHPGRYLSPRALPHRRPMMVDARSSEKVGQETEESLSAAARHLTVAETIEQSHPSARPMLEHIFGLNLPGRDRA